MPEVKTPRPNQQSGSATNQGAGTGGAAAGDPRTRYPQPPYEQQSKQQPLGDEDQMNPSADHGERSYRGSGRLAGKVALITGADSGIGRAVAIAFAREGADVAISYADEHDDACETERWVKEAGRSALVLPGDIRSEDHCKQLVRRTHEELGGFDILVNNAAFQLSYSSIAEIPTEEFDRVIKTNRYALFWLCKAGMEVLPPGGSIINVASIQAYQPSPSLLPYASTKGAIVNFTKALAKEAMEKGIRVNAVAPGPVWTPLIPSTLPPDHVKKFGQDTPLGRAAQPAELAPVFVLLASEESSYITAAIYPVTGGEITC